VRQVVIPQETTFGQLVLVLELYAPVFGLGETKEVVARVYYSGLEPLKVTAAFDLPSSFEVSPQATERTLQAASFSNFVFKVKAPKENPGTYIGTFSIQAEEGRIERTTSLVLAGAPLAADYSLHIAGAIAIAVLLAIFLVLRKTGEGGEKPGFETAFERERDTYLKEVKGLLKK